VAWSGGRVGEGNGWGGGGELVGCAGASTHVRSRYRVSEICYRAIVVIIKQLHGPRYNGSFEQGNDEACAPYPTPFHAAAEGHSMAPSTSTAPPTTFLARPGFVLPVALRPRFPFVGGTAPDSSP
jgi:hypothetical protein